VIISMRKALSLFYLCTEIITFPLKGRLSSFIVSGKFPYRVKFYTKGVQGSESASGACRPLIGDEREEAGSTGSEGSAGVAVHFVILSGEKRRM
ncbi:MAG: hypothetical protein MR506_05315, partial [Dialister sp.]|nr:hypothetical protein [Dialister sp.]